MRMKKIIIGLLALLLILSGSCLAADMSLLDGSWSVGAITYKNKIVDVHDVESVEDLYDTTFLWFDEDGSFGYMNLYNYSGSCVPFKENSYMLKVESMYRFTSENGGFGKEDIEMEKAHTYLI